MRKIMLTATVIIAGFAVGAYFSWAPSKEPAATVQEVTEMERAVEEGFNNPCEVAPEFDERAVPLYEVKIDNGEHRIIYGIPE